MADNLFLWVLFAWYEIEIFVKKFKHFYWFLFVKWFYFLERNPWLTGAKQLFFFAEIQEFLLVVTRQG